MTQQIMAQARNSKYNAAVVDFVQKDSGCFIAVSEDPTFLALLRTVLTKHLGLSGTGVLRSILEMEHVLKALNEAVAGNRRPFLLMERQLGGQETSLLIKQYKTAFPNLLILILTADIEKHRIMYLHEVGADNFIAKPVSAQTLVEKLAFTIKPQGQLGQLIDRAKTLLAGNEPEKAKELAGQILDLKPNSAAGLMVLGDAEQAIGNIAAARQAYTEASNNADLYLEPLRRLAKLSESTGNLEECLGYLEKLDSLSPLNSERKINMGQINLDLGQDEKAHRLFEKAVSQSTREAMAQIGLMAERIAAIYAEKDPARSEEYLRKAMSSKDRQLTRDDIHLFNKLGISLRQQGKWLEAVTEYQRALKIVPDDENLLYNLALAYAQGKEMHSARLCLDKALKINPELGSSSAGVAYSLGFVYMHNGLNDQAKKFFQLALELNPEMEKARQQMSKL